jgi:protein-L-isoaspartate(D-aspartate) O-methyltransferase
MTSSGQADALREAMTDRLVADGWITSPHVEAAFRAVPRHLFVPDGTPLDKAYNAERAVITKRDADGASMSSVSAPWLQAKMIAQAGIAPGMRVLEVGSGGYNAALLAEVTGPQGRVVSMDIDPEVTARARSCLEAARYGPRVTVMTGDGEHGVPEHAPYDAIVVTVGTWDLPPSWGDQLAGDGVMAVPLLMNTFTRSLALRRAGDHWASTSAQLCGFVAMRGLGGREPRRVQVRAPGGGRVTLRFDETAPPVPGLLDGALSAGPASAWSGVTIGRQVGFEDLHLWLAAFLPGFCRIDGADVSALPAGEAGKTWFGFGGTDDGSFSVLALRPTGVAGAEYEFGARAYGPSAQAAADALADQVTAWDACGRALAGDAFAYWPADVPMTPPPGRHVGVFRKRHGTVTVAWAPAV